MAVKSSWDSRILQEIRDLLNKGWRVELVWIPHEINGPADWIIKRSYQDRLLEFTVMDSPPQELKVLLLQDSLGVL